MALITEIRKRFWLVLILLGFALAAFIMMDAQSFGGGGNTDATVGKIGDRKLDWNEFQIAHSTMYPNSSDIFNSRNTMWDFFVEDAIVADEAEALGLKVTDDMLHEMKRGTNLSPTVQAFFPNAQTGQFDRQFYNNFIQQLDAGTLDRSAQAQWEYLDHFIKKDYLQSQLNSMAVKGIYTPSWQAEEVYKDQRSTVDFEYVRIPYNEISGVEVTDQDIQAYYNAHKSEFKTSSETRNLEYLTLEAFATAADSMAIFNTLNNLKTELASTEGDSTYVVDLHEGQYPMAYLKRDQLTGPLKDVAFDLAVGDVYGPYIENGNYTIAKVVDRKEIPDSVEVRHILRRVQTMDQVATERALMDSLKNLVETGQARFDSLAVKFSQDPGSGARGGDLGSAYPGQMVGPFNDLIFYQAEEDKLYIIGTQFGFHLVQVTKKQFVKPERDGVRLAYIRQPIIPSENTQDDVLDKANDILVNYQSLEELRQYADENNLTLQTSNDLEENDHSIAGLSSDQNSRNIIQWAYLPGVEPGDISPEVHIFDNQQLYYNEKFVIAGLKSITPEGTRALADVTDDIRPLALNQKRSESLASTLTGKSLEDIARQFKATKVDTSSGTLFNAPLIAGLGKEPVVLANAIKSDVGNVVGPIAGNGGVFYIRVTHKTDAGPIDNLAFYRNTSATGTKQSLPVRLIQAIRDDLDIEDLRSTFY